MFSKVLQCPFSIIIIRNIRKISLLLGIANDVFMAVLDTPWNFIFLQNIACHTGDSCGESLRFAVTFSGHQIVNGEVTFSPLHVRHARLALCGLFMRVIISRRRNRCLRIYRVCWWTYRIFLRLLYSNRKTVVKPSFQFRLVNNWF